MPDHAGRPGAERCNPKDILLLVARDGVVPRFGKDHRDATIIGNVLTRDTNGTVIAATHSHDAVLGDQFFHQGSCLLWQAFRISNHDLNVTAEYAPGGIDVPLRQNHRVTHGFAAGHGARSRKRSKAANLDGAVSSQRWAAQRYQPKQARNEPKR